LEKVENSHIFRCKIVVSRLLIDRDRLEREGRPSVTRPSFRDQLGPIWRRKYQRWVRYAWRLVGTGPDAEDVVQDAAHSSLKANPGVSGEVETDAYMHAAIRSGAKKHARRFGGRTPGSGSRARAAQVTTGEQSLVDIAIQIEDELEDDRLANIAMDGLGLLPNEQREALTLVVLTDPKMTLREVAERQGVSISAVRWRVNKALETLREIDEAFSRGGR